ncbi:MAG: sulfatase [Acidobacteria bacterium]|nr:sulfatase [Acidobacteriota bacterium]
MSAPRMFILLVLLTAKFAALSVAQGPAPNVVIVFADDQGYGDVGVYGAKEFRTPNLDRMASEGVRFTSFYVAAPVCTPSRAALLTGSHPVRVGLGNRVLFPYSTTGLHPNEVTVAEILRSRGYATGIVGKWHLGHHTKFLPTRQGFDTYFGIPYSNDMGNHRYARENFVAPPLPILRDEEIIEQQPDQTQLTRRYTEEAIRFIRDNKDRPFFLYLPHSMPHWPLAASERFAGHSKLGIYGDAIEELDWSVGEILKTLGELGIDRRTLVIFTSDNGATLAPWQRRGYRPGSNGPLRAGKNTTWEGGMRVPAIMRWPGRIPAGLVQDELATAMDILPTIAKLTGAEAPRGRILDGKNIWPLMSGEAGARTPHEAFHYYRDERLQAVRSGPWKLHVYRPEWGDGAGDHQALLFNLDEDIGENVDVAGANADVVTRLLALAEKAREDLGDAATGRQGRNVRPVGRL